MSVRRSAGKRTGSDLATTAVAPTRQSRRIRNVSADEVSLSTPTKASTKRSKRATDADVASTPFVRLSDEVMLRVAAFMDVTDLLEFTNTACGKHSGFGNEFWESVLRERCTVAKATFKKGTRYREKVVAYARSKRCRNCKVVNPANQRVRRQSTHFGWVLCRECLDLPRFHEIEFHDAIQRFGLEDSQLNQLRFRTKSASYENYRERGLHQEKLFNLQKVMDLAASCKPKSARPM